MEESTIFYSNMFLECVVLVKQLFSEISMHLIDIHLLQLQKAFILQKELICMCLFLHTYFNNLRYFNLIQIMRSHDCGLETTYASFCEIQNDINQGFKLIDILSKSLKLRILNHIQN